MKSNYKNISVLCAATALAFIGLAGVVQAAALSDQDKQFLNGYGKAHDALVADDLATAKTSAADLGSDGVELSKSNSLDQARSAFGKLSDKAAKLAASSPN